MRRIFFKILFCITLIVGITGYWLFKHEPILIKWIVGEARDLGAPIHANVYTNGKYDSTITVYRINKYWGGKKTNAFLLVLSEPDAEDRLKFIKVDLLENWVGSSICSAGDCYSVVLGRLFQSDSGGIFIPFEDDIKGYGFNPQLTFSNRQINFNVPPKQLKFETIRIDY